MDTVFGLVGGSGEDSFCLLAADGAAGRSILMFSQGEDKIRTLDGGAKALAMSGAASDNVQFGEYIERNMKLYELNDASGMPLSTSAAANYIRTELATALRRAPYQCNVLLGGYDAGAGASLYFCDYLATLQQVNFGAHGYTSNFLLSVFDRDYKEGLDLEQAMGIIDKCIHTINERFLINQREFYIKIVDKNGTRVLRAPTGKEAEVSEPVADGGEEGKEAEVGGEGQG